MGDFYKQLEAVNRDWRNFEFIEGKGDERLQKAAINKSGHSLGLMSGLSVDVLVYAAKMYPDDEYVAKYVLSNLSDHSILGDDVLSRFVCIDSSIIGLVKNPSEAVQLEAAKRYGYSILGMMFYRGLFVLIVVLLVLLKTPQKLFSWQLLKAIGVL